jgi:hypothetical protein
MNRTITNTFLAILGHDLRSPLTVIAMSAHRLAISGKVAATELEVVTRIRQSVLSMNLMIRDLSSTPHPRKNSVVPISTMWASPARGPKRCKRAPDCEMTSNWWATCGPNRIARASHKSFRTC